MTEQARAIGARTEPVLIPWDCADGFFEAHWRRPEAYLDEDVRRGVSVWARVGPDAEQRAVRGLRDDLASGRWAERNRDLASRRGGARPSPADRLNPRRPHLRSHWLRLMDFGEFAESADADGVFRGFRS
ncbi:hypothetical protein GCM10012289_39040 [Nonomuraea cavernae]|uniref:Uncharacterized protein n=1 Tax=Nonomuraea cavernae TaxID=2045107 RepID=A0A918DMB5_9ACTN|nr:hypothetical protein GCM10012289_39040 [Nonomuraea cavernae]